MKRTRILSATLASLFLASSLSAAQMLTVTTPGDPNHDTGGASGTLRNVLNNINESGTNTYTVNFNLPSGQQTIVLKDILPLLNLTSSTNNLIIDGANNGNPIVLDGDSKYRGFFATQGNVTIQNMSFQNMVAKGGDGGGFGGGGMGAGSVLFVDQAAVSLANVTMSTNTAIGGNGGADENSLPGGGGGLGGNGGLFYGGGGGLSGNGGNSLDENSSAGGGGIGPGGNGGDADIGAFAGQDGGAYGAASAGTGYNNVAGGLRGGGGGGGNGEDDGGGGGGGIAGNNGAENYEGGNGGYGGGGGSDGGGGAGNGGFGGGGSVGADGGFGGGGGLAGDGGFGGGGGGSDGIPFGVGGTGAGNGTMNGGGAGAALGGAIFVNAGDGGSLAINGPLATSGSVVTPGTGANIGAAAATDIFSVSGSTLVFNPSSSQVVTISGSIGDDSVVTLPTGQSYTAGSGIGVPLLKQGAGTLILQGINTYAGLTTVQAGELRLIGSIAADILVQANALLSGIGTVGGNCTIENGGTISPGNSIGTLNILGNYIQNAGSTYFLEIDGAGGTDLINVSGSAGLNGGQVVVTSLDGAVANTPYTILTSSEGVIGQFAGVSTTNLLQTPILTYDTNNVYLSFSQTVFSFDAVTPNQIAVATQLEGITDPTPEELLILTTLAGLSPAEQQAALNQMSGEQYASLNLAAEIAGRQFIRRLYDPLRSIVTTEPCNDCCCACPCPTLDVWFEAGGGQTFLDGNANARGFKLSGYEVTAGVQSTFNCDWTVGIAGSYAEDRIKYDIGNNGRNRMGFGAIYGLYRPSNFYVLADLAFGGGQFTVNRSIDIGDLAYSTKGRPTHYQGLAYIEAGFDWNTCSFLIQPFIGFEGGYYRRNHVSESGTSPLNLNINKQSYGNAFSRLGVHLTTEQWSALKLSVDVAWDCRLTSTKRSITENFQSFGDAFTITGIPGHRNSVDVAVTGITKLCDGWELYLEAGGEFWSKVSTYNILGGVKYSW